jgi:hypothetical protein
MDHERLADAILREGVWFPPSLLERLPVLRPYVIRDNAAHKRGISDERGFPDSDGFYRADNSLIKTMPPRYADGHQRKLPARFKGWNTSHVWRNIKDGNTSNFNPLLHSFIGNLVWLPEDLGKQTNEEGGFGQTVLKAISWRVFKPDLSGSVSASFNAHIWEYLPYPDLSMLPPHIYSCIDSYKISHFDIDVDRFSAPKFGLMRALLKALAQIEETGDSTKLEIITYLPMSLHRNYSAHLPHRLESSRSFLRLKEILHHALSLQPSAD